MNAICAICISALSPSSEVCVTRCGHAFHRHCILRWTDASSSCPQCRDRADRGSIVRVFFECRDRDDSELDAKIAALEAKLRDKNAETATLRARVEYLTANEDRYERTRKHNEDLADRLARLEGVREIVDGTVSEVETMLQSAPDLRKLCTYVVILKRAIVKSEAKKKNLRETLRHYEREKQKENGYKSELVSKIKLLESSVSHYEDKCKELKDELSKLRIENAGFKNVDALQAFEEKMSMVLMNNDSTSEEVYNSSSTSKISILSQTKSDLNGSRLAISSPYMSLKQNYKLPLHNLQEKNTTDKSNKAAEFYILQKSLKRKNDIENTSDFDKMTKKQNELETVYDGLGGHFKPYTISKATHNSAKSFFVVAKKRKRS